MLRFADDTYTESYISTIGVSIAVSVLAGEMDESCPGSLAMRDSWRDAYGERMRIKCKLDGYDCAWGRSDP